MSSDSKEDDEPKRQKKESLDILCLGSPTSLGKVFAERLRSNECVEALMNCLKNLGNEVKQLKDLASSNDVNQIKGERQLMDLKDAVDSISNKFDDFERDRLEKEKNIKEIKEELTYLMGKVGDITA